MIKLHLIKLFLNFKTLLYALYFLPKFLSPLTGYKPSLITTHKNYYPPNNYRIAIGFIIVNMTYTGSSYIYIFITHFSNNNEQI